MGKKMDSRLEALKNHICESDISNSLKSVCIEKGELSLQIEPSNLKKVIQFLKNDSSCLFKMLVDICAVDYPEQEKRFEVVYNLLSVEKNLRIRIKTAVSESQDVPSLTPIYPAAGWFEREIWDLFGVRFSEHADLRRILTDYGFEGHPLRKDFPLTGHVEVRYDIKSKQVVYEPVQLTQDYRSFDFISPWEGPEYTLPGDEKATK
jgi:NADH-quinone oxidoreductase subunit C